MYVCSTGEESFTHSLTPWHVPSIHNLQSYNDVGGESAANEQRCNNEMYARRARYDTDVASLLPIYSIITDSPESNGFPILKKLFTSISSPAGCCIINNSRNNMRAEAKRNSGARTVSLNCDHQNWENWTKLTYLLMMFPL